MFESVNDEKSPERALSKAATIFRVLGTVSCVVLVLGTVLRITGDQRYGLFVLAWYAIFAVLAFTAANGVERGRQWGKRLGYSLGFLSLINVPIGTIIGVAVIIYIQRASKAGLFTNAPPSA
jgi:hypothetical protein